MGLLDDLGREADAARRRRVAESGGRERQAADAAMRLQPALERVEDYVGRLVAHLRDIDRTVTADYPVKGFGRLEGLAQRDYRADWQDQGGRRRYVMFFRCVGSRPLEQRVDSEAVAAATERDLRSHGLRTSRPSQGRGGVRLRVEPEVPVSLAFEADAVAGRLIFESRNLFGLGTRSHRFEPARVDEALLDALGQAVLRDPAPFDRLVGNRVDETRRRQLARDLARDRRRRAAELGGPLRRALFPLAEWFRRTLLGG